MGKKKTYKYTIELTEEMWPRYIADCMSMLPVFAQRLMSVQDLQRSDHWYAENNTKQGDTFIVNRD